MPNQTTQAPVGPSPATQNKAAEQAVLGAMIRDNKVIADVALILRREDFYFADHQHVFTAIAELFAEGQPADVVTVANRLLQKQVIKDVTYPVLGELLHASPAAANAVYHARIVRERSIARSMLRAAQEIISNVQSKMPAVELLDSAERAIFSIAQLGVSGHTYPVDSVMQDAFDRIDARSDGSISKHAVPSGLMDLDELMCGMQNSELCVLAARPSVGKTALGLQIACQAAMQDVPVFFVSLEMSRAELAERLLVTLSGVDGHKLRRGCCSKDDMAKLMYARSQLRGKPLHFDDASGQSAIRILANGRRLKLRYGIRLIVVDYLQLVDPDNRKDSRQEQVASVARRLKRMAKELSLPVLAMAQLSRGADSRNEQEPELSDLRESGGIEADADTVLLMYRPDRTDRKIVRVKVAKQRNGRVGQVTLFFRQECMRFENYTDERPFAG